MGSSIKRRSTRALYGPVQLIAAGSNPKTWTVVVGTPPPGITLNTAGILAGVPTTGGVYNFTVRATNVAGFADKVLSITIKKIPVVPVQTLPSGVLGRSYTYTMLLTIGFPTPAWSIASGVLPAGLSIDSVTGIISGTISAAVVPGVFTFTVRATNSAGNGDRQVTLTVGTIPTFVTPTPTDPNVVVSTKVYTNTETAHLIFEKSVSVVVNISSGSIPPGLTLSVLQPTPTTRGKIIFSGTGTSTLTELNYSAVITISNGFGGDTATINFKVYPKNRLSVSTANVNQGVNAFVDLAPVGTPGITVSVSNSTPLPNGLDLSFSGVLTGPAAASGTTIHDIILTSPLDTETVSLTINSTPVAPTLSSASIPNAFQGISFAPFTFPITGTPPFTWSIQTGALPFGMSINTDGQLIGTPLTSGTFNFRLRATNGVGFDEKDFSIIVNPQPTPPTITTASGLPSTERGVFYTQTIQAVGTSPFTWDLNPGSNPFPPGLSIAGSTGVFSGTPTTGGSYNFTIRATNPAGTGTKAFSLTVVVNPPAFTDPPSTIVDFTQGSGAFTYQLPTSGSGPKTFTVQSGSFPLNGAFAPGIALDAVTGILSKVGTLNTQAVGSAVKIRVSNSAGFQDQDYFFGVPDVLSGLATMFVNQTNIYSNTTYTARVVFSNIVPRYFGKIVYSLTAGTLPPGMTLNAATGELITAGPQGSFSLSVENFAVTIRATNVNGFLATSPTLVKVGTATPIIASGSNTTSSGLPTGGPIVVPLSSALATASVGLFFTTTFDAGGNLPITWSFTNQVTSIGLSPPGGTGPLNSGLPAGMSFAPASQGKGGTISGTPTQSGTRDVIFTGNNTFGNSAQAHTMAIGGVPEILTPTTVPAGAVNVAYTVTQLFATTDNNGAHAATFFISSGALPSGMSLNTGQAGRLQGTPTAGGTFNFGVKASTIYGQGAEKLYSLIIQNPPVIEQGALVSGFRQNFTLPAATAGQAYTHTFLISGTTPLTVKATPNSGPDNTLTTPAPVRFGSDLVMGEVVSGLSISDTGIISGTVVANSQGPRWFKPDASPGSYSGSLSGAVLFKFANLGGQADARYLINVHGAPIVSKFTRVTLLGGGASSSQLDADTSHTVYVGDTLQSTNDGTGFVQDTTANRTYLQVYMRGTDFPADQLTMSLQSGSLPPGVTIQNPPHSSSFQEFAYLIGTVTASGTFNFQLRGANSYGAGASVTLTLVVDGTARIGSTSLAKAGVGVPYDQNLSVRGDTPVLVTVFSGALPPSLSINGSNHIVGTASVADVGSPFVVGNTTAAGIRNDAGGTLGTTHTFTLRASGPGGQTDTPLFIIVRSKPLLAGYLNLGLPVISRADPDFRKQEVGVQSNPGNLNFALKGSGIDFVTCTGLPPGMTLTTSTFGIPYDGNSADHPLAVARIGGVPTTAGSYTVNASFFGTDPAGGPGFGGPAGTTSISWSFTVYAALTSTPQSPTIVHGGVTHVKFPDAQVGVFYTQDITYSNGSSADGMLFQFASTLPPGLNAVMIQPNIIRVSGTPTQSGIYPFLNIYAFDTLGGGASNIPYYYILVNT